MLKLKIERMDLSNLHGPDLKSINKSYHSNFAGIPASVLLTRRVEFLCYRVIRMHTGASSKIGVIQLIYKIRDKLRKFGSAPYVQFLI